MVVLEHFALPLFGISLAVYAGSKRVVGLGKHITIPMALAYLRWTVLRQVKRGVPLQRIRIIVPSMFRVLQLLILFVVTVPSDFVAPFLISHLIFWIPYISLYVDDLLTLIDKDKWKKRWDSVKNKVKWKWLPQPMPSVG